MALVNALTDIKEYTPFKTQGVREFWGRVLDNEDPRMLGRIKVQIVGVLPFDDPEQLPWIYPLYPVSSGQSPMSGSLNIPEIESFVVVRFEDNSPYFGRYVGSYPDRQRRTVDLLSEYPHRKGKSDIHGFKHIQITTEHLCAEEFSYPNGSRKTHNFSTGVFQYEDPYGNSLYFDAPKHYFALQFGKLRIISRDGKVEFHTSSFILRTANYLRLRAKSLVSVASTTYEVLARNASYAVNKLSQIREDNQDSVTKHRETGPEA